MLFLCLATMNITKTFRAIIPLIALLSLSLRLDAQMQVNSSVTAQQMIQALIGNGLSVSNVQLNCAQGAYGTFTNGSSTNLGINNGIVLTTGSADTVSTPNNTSAGDATVCIGTSTADPDLILIDPTATNDVCILEFDIIPKCDSLTISFVFGSEEYPVFVNSINDCFGFFVTGPNPNGPNYASQNIALLPNSNTPVSINNVNNGNNNTGPCMNCQYYVDNTGGTTVTYNGFTVVINAGLAMVPCQTYHFKMAIADASDCILDSGVFIDFLSCITGFTATTASTPDVCNSCNGTATVTVSGGSPPYTYQWLPSGGNNATATNLCAGTYTVLVQDQSSCGIPDTLLVTVPSNGSITANAQLNNPTCAGDCNGSIVVTPTSGSSPFTYVWTPNVSATDSAGGLCAGSYTVSTTDATGCSNTFTYVLTQPPALTLGITGNDTICNGDASTLTANPSGGTGPYTIGWSTLATGPSETVSPQATTTYTAVVTDANGCSAQQTFTLAVVSAPVAAFTAGPGNCAPALVQFTDNSTSATSWQWDFGDPASPANTATTQNPTHTYNSAGVYTITLIVSNGGGCTDTFTLTNAVTILPAPVAGLDANFESVSELAPDIQFTDLSTGSTDCILYYGDGDSTIGCNFSALTHTYPAPGVYTAMLVVTNPSGCADTVYLQVTVEEEATVYVPNAFSPNGNGNNEVFYAYGTNVEEFQMLIFDRWGNLVFTGNAIDKGWDGTLNGKPCQQDVYVWKINWSDPMGKRYQILGHVTLVR
jgi:gliding motility-associated-like protein